VRPILGIAAVSIVAAHLTFPHAAAGTARDVYDPRDYGYRRPRGCLVPNTPPHLTGMALSAATRDAAERTSRRLGFAGYWEDDVLVCPIRDGALLWVVGPSLPPEIRVPERSPMPLAHRSYEPPDRSLPLGFWPISRRLRSASPPVGDGGRLDPIAIVPDADSVARVWPPPTSEGDDVPLLNFRPTRRFEKLAARGLVAAAGGWSGTVILLEPDSDDGPAARWLGAAGPRWLGFEIAVSDIDRTARLLAERGLHSNPLDDDAIWVDPEQTGGVLVVFRQLESSRPQVRIQDPR
jgi:hypothetical protein